jgi:tyrosyl-tRNA synthetase
MADSSATQDEIAQLEKKLAEVQQQLKDAKSRLQKSQATDSNGDAGNKMSQEEKLDLIKVNLAEVLNPEIMDEALKKSGTLKIYWGTATTGRPHCGYVRPPRYHKLSCAILTLEVVRPHPQNRTIPRRRLPRQDTPRRHTRLPR